MHTGFGQSCGVLTLVTQPGMGSCHADLSAVKLGQLWLCITASSLYCLPSRLVSDSFNLIFGVSLKIFKPFVMIAIPQQLLFLLGMGSVGQISAWFGPALHHEMQSWLWASAGK